ncbi:MAG: hypothetical protein KC800_32305 [Candidatus Eremiobacteraeota bacterium]|nr:hypothetical protein [Candidatus Eremiobacteraeota bacterium]
MDIQQKITTQTRLTTGPNDCGGAHTVTVDGQEREFELDGQMEEYIPSRDRGDVRSLKDAFQLVAQPKVQKVFESIRSTNSLGAKVDLGKQGTWDVHGHFGSFTISRLEPKDGQRHGVTLRGDRVSLFTETRIGQDLVKQEIVGRRSEQGKPRLIEELLTVESTVDLVG